MGKLEQSLFNLISELERNDNEGTLDDYLSEHIFKLYLDYLEFPEVIVFRDNDGIMMYLDLCEFTILGCYGEETVGFDVDEVLVKHIYDLV